MFAISIMAFELAIRIENILIYSLISTLTFWIAIILLIPKKFWNLVIDGYGEKKVFLFTFIPYLMFHYFIYGVFLTSVLFLASGYFPLVSFFHIGYGYSIPEQGILNYIYWITYSPAVWIFISYFEIDLIPYSLFMGFIIALLVASNVAKLFEIKKSKDKLKRGNASILIIGPFLGLLSGAACCITLPNIIIYALVTGSIIATQTASLISSSPAYFLLTYFALPLLSVFVLYTNLNQLNSISRKIYKKSMRL